MRTVAKVLTVVGLISIAACGTFISKPAAEAKSIGKETPEDKLIVHEWGTFTSVTGSDGVRLEFRPLLDNDLPQFVVNRAWQAGRMPNPFVKWDIRSLQRMETPVTYFYTDREREINVKVGFPKGLLTEFYPPVTSMKPAFDFKKRAEIGNSELDWGKVTLIPMDSLTPSLASSQIAKAAQRRIVATLAPESQSHPHYKFARETDSAFVYVPHQPDETRPVAPAGDHFEKFLFYRGVGNFPLPLNVTARGSNAYEISNIGTRPLRSLFLVTCVDRNLYVQYVNSIDGGAKLSIKQSIAGITYRDLSNRVVQSLIEEGLYEKEARAMVNTWQDSWFGEEGTRLFYMLPRQLTDELLPLTISPAPDQILRVMVGRLEIISPEVETRITGMIQASAQSREARAKQSSDKSKSPRAGSTQSPVPELPQALLQMGRLAEPSLVRIKSFTKDNVIRAEASLLLNELQHFHANLVK